MSFQSHGNFNRPTEQTQTQKKRKQNENQSNSIHCRLMLHPLTFFSYFAKRKKGRNNKVIGFFSDTL